MHVADISVTAPTKLSKKLIDGADIVFVMEYKLQNAVLRLSPKAWENDESLERQC